MLAEYVGEVPEIANNKVRLVRRLTKRKFAAIDVYRAHAKGFRTDTIERVTGHEQAARSVDAHDLDGFGVRLPVGLEIASLLHRDDMVEGEANVRRRCFQHVGVTIREHGQYIAPPLKPFESRRNIRKRL